MKRNETPWPSSREDSGCLQVRYGAWPWDRSSQPSHLCLTKETPKTVLAASNRAEAQVKNTICKSTNRFGKDWTLPHIRKYNVQHFGMFQELDFKIEIFHFVHHPLRTRWYRASRYYQMIGYLQIPSKTKIHKMAPKLICTRLVSFWMFSAVLKDIHPNRTSNVHHLGMF